MDKKSTVPAEQSEGQPRPIAYDAQGRPLYAAPPPTMMKPDGFTTPQAVHVSRAVEPIEPAISDEVKARHDASVKDYPSLSLSNGEYIVSVVPRHPIGRIIPLGISTFFVVVIAAIVFSYPKIVSVMGSTNNTPPFSLIAFIGLLLILVVVIAGYTAAWVYSSNKLFLTNESVIQEMQSSLFSHDEQTVSLMNVEDVSFEQKGIMQMLFNYGSIRLSTEGEESSYRLTYVALPKQQIAILDNAVESFKNGRPVDSKISST